MPLLCMVLKVQPDAVVMASETLWYPGSAYVCVGFCNVEVVPSPNCQNHDTAPKEESKKLTSYGGHWSKVSVKAANPPWISKVLNCGMFPAQLPLAACVVRETV